MKNNKQAARQRQHPFAKKHGEKQHQARRGISQAWRKRRQKNKSKAWCISVKTAWRDGKTGTVVESDIISAGIRRKIIGWRK